MKIEKDKERIYGITQELEDFFFSDEARGIRLQVDYEKAEVRLKEEGVKHTVVVFGSARIKPADVAIRELEEIETKVKQNPDVKELLRELERAKIALHKSVFYEEARKFGQLVGKGGKGPQDCTVTLMTGGGPGIMEAANRGAHDVGAKSIGLNIRLPHEQHPNPYITPELSFSFYYFGIRKLHFMQRAKALVVFPGGFGTLDELFDILTLVQTGKNPRIPILLVSKAYWSKVIDFTFLAEEGVIDEADLELFAYVESAEEAWAYILRYYEEKGEPLYK
jgi:uncharacterized protein (TIGR00730 family)